MVAIDWEKCYRFVIAKVIFPYKGDGELEEVKKQFGRRGGFDKIIW